jgi:hypothetical protein
MQTATQTIKVARTADGWKWTLIDVQGAPAAVGTALEQQAALETAWLAARAFSGGPLKAYPEVIVEQVRSARPR